jgi:uncharacterized membrane protein (DUF485 family)
VGHERPPHWRRARLAALKASEEFRRLRSARRRFVGGALLIFVPAVAGFLICCGYARHFMGRSVDGPLTVGYVWLLALTLLTWVIAWSYLRFSTRTLAPQAESIARDLGVPARAAEAEVR